MATAIAAAGAALLASLSCTPASPATSAPAAPANTAGSAAAPPSTGWVEPTPRSAGAASCTPKPGADPFATQHPCDNSGLATPLDPGQWYRITTVINGAYTHCLDAAQGSINDDRIELHHRDCNGSTNQAWSPYVESLACSGCYILKNNQAAAVRSDHQSCLQTLGGETERFRWFCDNRPVTFFGFTAAGEIKYEAAPWCLDWENEHPECDGMVQIKPCNGSPNQKWHIEPFGAPMTGPPSKCPPQQRDNPVIHGGGPRQP